MHAGVWLYYSNAGSRGLAFSNLLHCSVRAIVDPSLQNIIAKPSITQPEILLAILGGVYTRAGTQRDAAETPGSYWLCYWSIDHFQASLRSASDHPSDMVPAKRPLSHGASSHSSGQVDDPKKARYEGPMESEQPLLDLMYNGFSTADAPAGCTIVAATTSSPRSSPRRAAKAGSAPTRSSGYEYVVTCLGATTFAPSFASCVMSRCAPCCSAELGLKARVHACVAPHFVVWAPRFSVADRPKSGTDDVQHHRPCGTKLEEGGRSLG
jgi:hypothetical protein